MDLMKPHLAREQLDLSLAKLRPLAETRRPVKGWLRAIRTGLGMTGVELARHLGVKPPRVVEMEKNELDGAISLKVLERAAEAMGCSLVYALIPRAGSLEQTLKGKTKSEEGGAASTMLSFFDPADAVKPLAVEEILGLKLDHIATRGELNRWECMGIQEAEAWALARKNKDLFSQRTLQSLHLKMFDQVWKGAGAFRTSDITGSAAAGIPARLAALFENARYWAKAKVYQPDEACARFHHRLASIIRPFPFGNGRHARLLTDLILIQVYHRPRFTWGSASSLSAVDARKRYREALRAADGRDFKPLLAFVRS